jgi:CheY-like chemotaxis protein
VPHSLSILIVDDEREVGEIMGVWLREEGHSVVHCRSGVEALQKVQLALHAFDLVITDHYMPGSYSGVGLARVLRTKRIQTQIVVMSGQLSPDLKEEYEPYDVLGFLPKPLVLEHLQAFLQMVIMA